jgi:serine O-acetyltransferase
LTSNSAFRQDLARYKSPIRWTDRGLWAIAVYRLGRIILEVRNDPIRRLMITLYLPLARAIETVAKTTIPVFAQIGGGLRIVNGGMIFLHSDCVIGRNCTLRRGVTIGNAREDGAVPTIGDDVDIGAYAQILGDIRVGDGARIGSMSVVLEDIPAGASAIGIPAKVYVGAVSGRVGAHLAALHAASGFSSRSVV